MKAQAHNLKDLYKRKESDKSMFERNPNLLAPTKNKYMNHFFHFYLSLTLINEVGKCTEYVILPFLKGLF